MKKSFFKTFLLISLLLFLSGCPIKSAEEITGTWKHQSVVNSHYYLIVNEDSSFEIIKFVNGVSDTPVKGSLETSEAGSLSFKVEEDAKVFEADMYTSFLRLKLDGVPMLFTKYEGAIE
ncbi:MAG: hypothetical protein JXR63_08500 [Spirochaetales bacterium]|nr:hypothetical protein [Spirochaetales bacterium]